MKCLMKCNSGNYRGARKNRRRKERTNEPESCKMFNETKEKEIRIMGWVSWTQGEEECVGTQVWMSQGCVM